MNKARWAVRAFNELKENLFEQIELSQPDFNNKFTLITELSDIAIGAVLSQKWNPITFTSETLTKLQLYASNKKKLLHMVWA